MFTDTQPNGELANQCVTASCLAHGRKVWTGGDAHEWRHQDNKPCAGQATTHSAGCTCWHCQGDPFAGIPGAHGDPDPFALTAHDPAGCGCGAHQGGPGNVVVVHPFTLSRPFADDEHQADIARATWGDLHAAANVVVVDPADLAGFLADVNRRELERELAELRAGYQPDLFDVATTELVEPGMNGVLF